MNDNEKQPEGGNPWMKSLLIWVGILVALALFVTMIDGRGQPAASSTIAYSTFLDKVQEGAVKEVNVAGDVITGTYSDNTHFRTYAPQDPKLTDRLREKNVMISAKPEEGMPIWQYLLAQSLPFLLFLGIAFFVLRQMQKNSGSGAMGFGKSRAKMLTQREGKVTFDDVAGIDEAREELQEIVEFLKDPTKFARLGGKIPKGALLVGSPGTGKTLLARAIAGEAGVPFFTISGSDFVDEDDAGRVFLVLLEHVADARGADADEHLDKVGARNGEERNTCLTRDRAGEQGLAGAGRADQQRALGDFAAQTRKLARVLEELDDLLQLFARFVDARDIVEGDAALLLGEQLGLRLAEAHSAARAAALLHLAQHEEGNAQDQDERQRLHQQIHPEIGLLFGLTGIFDIMGVEKRRELRIGYGIGREPFAILELTGDPIRRDRYFLDGISANLGPEVGIGDGRALLRYPLAVEEGDEHQERKEHACQYQRALDPGIALRFLILVHCLSLSCPKIGRRDRNAMAATIDYIALHHGLRAGARRTVQRSPPVTTQSPSVTVLPLKS